MNKHSKPQSAFTAPGPSKPGVLEGSFSVLMYCGFATSISGGVVVAATQYLVLIMANRARSLEFTPPFLTEMILLGWMVLTLSGLLMATLGQIALAIRSMAIDQRRSRQLLEVRD